jgi:hypothetical protein
VRIIVVFSFVVGGVNSAATGCKPGTIERRDMRFAIARDRNTRRSFDLSRNLRDVYGVSRAEGVPLTRFSVDASKLAAIHDLDPIARLE